MSGIGVAKRLMLLVILGGLFGMGVSYAEIVYVDSVRFNDDYYHPKPGIVVTEAATSADIVAAINDETKFKKEGSTITLLTNLLIRGQSLEEQLTDGGELRIQNEKWIFGDNCLLEVGGTLIVDQSELTSLNHTLGSRGRIQAWPRWQYAYGMSPWMFKITNSKISYMGWVGQGQTPYTSGSKEMPIFANNEVFHSCWTPNIGGYIINNWFHGNVQKVSEGTDTPESDGNQLINVGVIDGVGLFDGNLIENCAVNYLSISWGWGATVSNNIYHDIGAIGGGCVFRQKEGEKGTFVRNNLFYNGKGGGFAEPDGYNPANPAIVYSGSTHKEWGEVSGNIIHHWGGTPLPISGNGYLGQFNVKVKVLENFIFFNSNLYPANSAINLSKSGYFGSSWPVDVTIKDNNMFSSGSITGDAVNLVRSGNFVDGKFIDTAPADLADNFARVVLAPSAVWYKGRIQTITVAVAGLKPLNSLEVRLIAPSGEEIVLPVSAITSTAYAYDYLGEFDTSSFAVGQGTVTVYSQDNQGKNCQASANFEVRDMTLISSGLDVVPPSIVDHLPVGTKVPVDTTVSVLFSEPVDKTFAEKAFQISPAVNGSFSWSGNKMVFTPDLPLSYVTTYTINIGATIKDLAGNGLSFPESWGFTVVQYSHDSSVYGGKIIVYPNPYIKNKSENEKINFSGVEKEAVIRIYNSSGQLIKELSGEADGTSEWDIHDVVSGVYLYAVISAEGTKKGKISIIK